MEVNKMGFWVNLLGDTKANREIDEWDEKRWAKKEEPKGEE